DEGPVRPPGFNPLLQNSRGAPFDAPRETHLLLPDPQTVDQLAVPGGILRLEVIEQPPALADELEQSAPRVVVLLVRLEVLGQVMDALGEQRDLHLRRAGVALVGAELLHYSRFAAFVVQRALGHLFRFPRIFPPPSAGRAGRRAGASLRTKLSGGRGNVQAAALPVKGNTQEGRPDR